MSQLCSNLDSMFIIKLFSLINCVFDIGRRIFNKFCARVFFFRKTYVNESGFHNQLHVGRYDVNFDFSTFPIVPQLCICPVQDRI